MILPILTPMAVDPAHPFPHMPNLGFGVVLSLQRKNVSDQTYAIIPVPSHVPRFIALGKKKRDFVTIEDVLENFAPALFPDAVVTGDGVFRITRDSDIAVDEEAEDLVRHFEFLLKKRRRGRVIRLELNQDISADLKSFLIESFECWDEDIHQGDTLLGMTDLSQLVGTARPG